MGKTLYNNFVELLKYRAQNQANDIAYTFLADGENEEVSITYSELDMRAESIANELRSTCKVGDRALLLFPSCLEFISTFFGCLFAGIITVPVYPPRKNRKIDRLMHIISDCDAKVVLSVGTMFDNSLHTFQKNNMLNDLNWIKVDDVVNIDVKENKKERISLNKLALIQYTSGSTGDPKGIMVSHENLIENASIQFNSMEYSDKSIVVSWLPFFHDMGLIGIILQSIFGGFLTILMPPEMFISKPIRWLNAISKYKATHSFAPNFAYDLCCETIRDEQLEKLDLSSWRVALNGAEPVNAKTLEAFSQKMKVVGFKDKHHYPGYGLAESTLVVSCPDVLDDTLILDLNKEKSLNNVVVNINNSHFPSKKIVGCGKIRGDYHALIVDPDSGTACKNGVVGEIWLSGKSVAQGYWNNPKLTKEIFKAYTSDTKEGPFLRTGDLGFFYDNELFITGRLKDLIIIRGRNYYPQDIEYTVSDSHESLISGGTAAFSIESNSEEKLIIIQEVKRTSINNLNVKEVLEVIKAAIMKEYELQIHDIVLLKPMRLLKTSSGKVQRKANKKVYLESAFEDSVARLIEIEELVSTPAQNSTKYKDTDKRNLIAKKIANYLKIPQDEINVNASFESFGLDSLKTIRLIGELSEEIGKDLSPTLFYDYPTISLLSNHLEAKNGESSFCAEIINAKIRDIAIIGMSCRFPGADDVGSFWELLINGKDAISEVPTCRRNLIASGISKGGYLSNIDKFDAELFGISPKEAKIIDPQQRILLEESYNALLVAGIAPSDLAGSNTGVFIGISQNDYAQICLKSQDNDNPYIVTGSALSIAANRLSYFYDLKGPSIAVDTACSSSLVALHLAINSMRNGECSLAIVAGVNLNLNDGIVKALNNANMLASDGYCKTFDASADGYVRGEGCGVVVLKPLDQSLRNMDNIQAIIKGSAIVQDGRSNGLSAPNGIAQQEVINKALKDAQLAPKDLHFIETHGTGTKLGDPIEINSISNVYGKQSAQNKLFVGSVKANIGHLESAAGIAGLIKTVLCIQNKKLPKQLHFNTPNPYINWSDIPIKVPTEITSLLNKTTTLKAGVSSFGFGGMNAHVIIEEAQLEKEKNYIPVKKKELLAYSFNRSSFWVDQVKVKTGANGLNNFNNTLIDLLKEGRNEEIEKILRNDKTLKPGHFVHLPAILNSLMKNISTIQKPISNLIYQFQWKIKKIEGDSGIASKGHYIIFSEIDDIGEKLAEKLLNEYCQFSLVYRAESYKKIHSGKYLINPDNPDDYNCLINDIQKFTKLPIKHVVFLWNLNSDVETEYFTSNNLIPAQILGIGYILNLVKSLSVKTITAKIWLFTKSVHFVTGEEKINLASSCIWGLGKVIPLEYPQLTVSLVDFNRQIHEEENIIKQLITENPNENHVSIRNGQIYVGRLIGSKSEPKLSINFDAKATYMITGGLGALGMHTAGWMVDKGAKNLILVSRSKPTSLKNESIYLLEEKGCKVKVVQTDVCDFCEITKVFEQIDNGSSPLKGIVHAAGIEEFRLMKNMELIHMTKIMNPKVIGSWNLHELTKDMNLDFFIMFSSISSIWGAAGHAHYAAGNHFLESLALYRKMSGLPATSINWGPWKGGGMADDKRLEKMVKSGVTPLTPERGIEALKYILKREFNNSIVVDIDWGTFKQLFEFSGQVALFEEIETKTHESPPPSAVKKSDIQSQIKSTTKSEQIFVLKSFLQKEVAEVLEFEEGQLPGLDKGFTEMGIDSLMAVDLRDKLEESFNTNYPVTVLFEYPNINSLADFIAKETLNISVVNQKGMIEENIFHDSPQHKPSNFKIPSEKEAEDILNKELNKIDSLK